MKCYYHASVEAVAICKSCSRALCHECSSDVHPGTACLNRCESEVRAVNLMLERGKTVYEKTGGAYKRNAYWSLGMGIVFIIIGVIPIMMNKGYASGFLAIIGVFFVVSVLSNFKSGREISSVDESDHS